VPSTESCQVTVQLELQRMNQVIAEQNNAHYMFLSAVQSYDFEGAEKMRIIATACYEAGLDCMMRACRAAAEGRRDVKG